MPLAYDLNDLPKKPYYTITMRASGNAHWNIWTYTDKNEWERSIKALEGNRDKYVAAMALPAKIESVPSVVIVKE